MGTSQSNVYLDRFLEMVGKRIVNRKLVKCKDGIFLEDIHRSFRIDCLIFEKL